MKNQKRFKLTTPVGKSVYPKLVEPDTKFDDNGVFSCRLILSEEDYNAFDAQITTWLDAEYERHCKEAGRKKLKRHDSPPLKQNDDGDYELYAKQIARRETNKGVLNFSVALFDSTGKKINDPPNIGSGSKFRLSVEPHSWNSPMLGVGYTLRLRAAQLIELVEYNPGGGEAFGFGSEDGGFVSEDLGDALTDDHGSDAKVPF